MEHCAITVLSEASSCAEHNTVRVCVFGPEEHIYFIGEDVGSGVIDELLLWIAQINKARASKEVRPKCTEGLDLATNKSGTCITHGTCLEHYQEQLKNMKTSLIKNIVARLQRNAEDELVRAQILALQRQKDELIRKPDFPHKAEMLKGIDDQIAALKADRPDPEEQAQQQQAQEAKAPAKMETPAAPGKEMSQAVVMDPSPVYPGKGMANLMTLSPVPAADAGKMTVEAQENEMDNMDSVLNDPAFEKYFSFNKETGAFTLKPELIALLDAEKAELSKTESDKPASTVNTADTQPAPAAVDSAKAAPQDATRQPEFGTTNYTSKIDPLVKVATATPFKVGDPVTIKETGRPTKILEINVNEDPDWVLVAEDGNPVGLSVNVQELEAGPSEKSTELKKQVMERVQPKVEPSVPLTLQEKNETDLLFKNPTIEGTEGKTYE